MLSRLTFIRYFCMVYRVAPKMAQFFVRLISSSNIDQLFLLSESEEKM